MIYCTIIFALMYYRPPVSKRIQLWTPLDSWGERGQVEGHESKWRCVEICTDQRSSPTVCPDPGCLYFSMYMYHLQALEAAIMGLWYLFKYVILPWNVTSGSYWTLKNVQKWVLHIKFPIGRTFVDHCIENDWLLMAKWHKYWPTFHIWCIYKTQTGLKDTPIFISVQVSVNI